MRRKKNARYARLAARRPGIASQPSEVGHELRTLGNRAYLGSVVVLVSNELATAAVSALRV